MWVCYHQSQQGHVCVCVCMRMCEVFNNGNQCVYLLCFNLQMLTTSFVNVVAINDVSDVTSINTPPGETQ